MTLPTADGSATLSCPTTSCDVAVYVGVRIYPTAAPSRASATIGSANRIGCRRIACSTPTLAGGGGAGLRRLAPGVVGSSLGTSAAGEYIRESNREPVRNGY